MSSPYLVREIMYVVTKTYSRTQRTTTKFKPNPAIGQSWRCERATADSTNHSATSRRRTLTQASRLESWSKHDLRSANMLWPKCGGSSARCRCIEPRTAARMRPPSYWFWMWCMYVCMSTIPTHIHTHTHSYAVVAHVGVAVVDDHDALLTFNNTRPGERRLLLTGTNFNVESQRD